MTRKSQFAASVLPTFSFAFLFATGVSFVAGFALAETVPQPIAFSHKIHVTDYKLNCRFCHSSDEQVAVRQPPVGGEVHDVPPVDRDRQARGEESRAILEREEADPVEQGDRPPQPRLLPA